MDWTESDEVYGSTYAHDGRAYLMNIEPGVYVAVALIYERKVTSTTSSSDPGNPAGSDWHTTISTYRGYFPRELIDQTRVTVRPGEFAFTADIVSNQSLFFGEGDDCQRHFMVLIEDDRFGWSKLDTEEHSVRLDLHEMDAGPAARQEFLAWTRNVFANTGWVDLMDSAIAKTP